MIDFELMVRKRAELYRMHSDVLNRIAKRVIEILDEEFGDISTAFILGALLHAYIVILAEALEDYGKNRGVDTKTLVALGIDWLANDSLLHLQYLQKLMTGGDHGQEE